jgi:diaminohydroxyphosphoribosylaminopyrimidine deaminase/5-amino-6-(5-phosphoribosylamino)uracil reductase
VETDTFAREAERLNESYLVSVRERRPFVHARWASSLDGKIATAAGESRWISNEESREDSMRLREECDAILVGAGTVLADDPQLTRRLGLNSSIVPHRRIILDGALRVSPRARVFDKVDGTESWLVTAGENAGGGDGEPRRFAPFVERGVKVVCLPARAGGIAPADLLSELHRLDVRSLVVEGGGRTIWAFLAAGLVDRVTAYVAPLLLGGAGSPSPLAGEGFATIDAGCRLTDLTVERLGEDVKLTGRVSRAVSS